MNTNSMKPHKDADFKRKASEALRTIAHYLPMEVCYDELSDGKFIYRQYICPNCRKQELSYENKEEICPRCGQRLYWGDEE